MQSYIGVLARSRVPLVDKKWAEIPKDIKEQIWEAVDMAFVVGQGGKKLVLSFAAKKWKDFKSTVTRLKLEYNHRLSRKGYTGLEDQLEETMPGVEIDRSTLWKKARQDKHGNILDPKVAEKAKLIDELQKQVSEGSLTVSGSNDVLTMALGPEHPGRVRGVGVGISPSQYFNLPRQQRVKFANQLKESVRLVLQEENLKMEARSREETLKMEARTKQLVEVETENFLSQLSQLIPNFDPSMLKPKTSPCQNQGQEQSPKNPMSDKASCSRALDGRSRHFEDDTAKNGEKQDEMKSRDLEKQDEEKKDEKQDEEKQDEKFAKGKDQAPYPQAAIDEVRKEWAEFVCLYME
ncbi:PREDICTED: uncharacterized protein LOC103327109 [Prunus mume]|uniref:Uncharacterized protein LOC103327109 n=1 Tax=Prunus mume TaxID=102107 RepID=A0ABM0NNY0_PRUMU|nr:PREDICTED: uncharacterized protein LOC103327109 [Prunus mume]